MRSKWYATLTVVFVVLLLSARGSAGSVTSLPALPPAMQRLQVSPDGRLLVKRDGSPFFWLGDTAWFLPQLSPAEISHYLADRARNGFTVTQVDLGLYYWDAVDDTRHVILDVNRPTAPYMPYVNGNPDVPNELYWRHVDWMIDEAGRHGLYVALTVLWGQFYPEVFRGDVEKARRLGLWLGRRYRDRSNVLWIVAGEYPRIEDGWRGPISPAAKALFNAMAQGLEEGHENTQLMTIHPVRDSAVDFHDEPWLDFNMLQSGHEANRRPENHELLTADYNRTPIKPVVDAEACYEGKPEGIFRNKNPNAPRMGADVARRKAYWAVLAGAFGHTYGHDDVQVCYVPGESQWKTIYARNHWKTWFDAPGATALGNDWVLVLTISAP